MVVRQATPPLNFIVQRAKNGRLGSKKSRKGCFTCKIRRVKCDEKKPECDRCRLTGRKCDGYAHLAQTTKNGSSLIERQISLSLDLQGEDKRTFDFFLSCAAPRLSGTLDKDFWSGYVLQISRSESFVRDALLAISTQYEHPQFPVPSTDLENDESYYSKIQQGSKKLDEHHVNALQLYNRAIQTFKSRVESGEASPLLVLLSCVLFICIELVRDNSLGALSLFTRGTKLLRDLEGSLHEEKEQGLVLLIRFMFARLGVIAATAGHPGLLERPVEAVTLGQRTVFSKMSDARTAMFDLMADSHTFIRHASAWKESLVSNAEAVDPCELVYRNMLELAFRVRLPGYGSKVDRALSETGSAVLPATINLRTGNSISPQLQPCPDDGVANVFDVQREERPKSDQPQTSLTLEILREHEIAMQKRLGRWLDAFQWPRTEISGTHPETVSYLLMYYHICTIWLSTRLNLTQKVFDDFTYHFKEIVHHAQVYLEAKAVEQSIFSFEVGALPPLYFVATKCRIPSLRRRALDLFAQAPGRECMWSCANAAELSCRLISVEEEGLGLPLPNCNGHCADGRIDDRLLPGEENRVHSLEILSNVVTGARDLRLTRYTHLQGRLLRRIDDFPL